MNELKYTVSNFDAASTTISVDFDDGTWAQIRLTKPLPKNKEELENLIKQFAAPVEAIQAIADPDADLSYINDLVGVQGTTTRKSLSIQESPALDDEVGVALELEEQAQFKEKIVSVLRDLGVVSS